MDEKQFFPNLLRTFFLFKYTLDIHGIKSVVFPCNDILDIWHLTN